MSMFRVHRKANVLLVEDCRKGESSWLKVSIPIVRPTSPEPARSGQKPASSTSPYQGIVDLEEVARVPDDTDSPPIPVDAIYGVYNLLSGPHMAFMKKSRVVGKGPGGEVLYQMMELEFLPVSETLHRQFNSSASKQEKKDEAIYLNMLVTIGKTQMFYYSFEYHLTLSAQRRFGTTPLKLPMHLRADETFFWNKPVLEPFFRSQHKLDKWIVPVINGYVKVMPNIRLGPDAPSFDFFFFTRRSWHRVGTRFNVRGVDKDGHTANFAETEMLMRRPDGSVCSYVQIRGSIPLYWDQMVTLKYMPRTRYAYSSTESIVDWNELAFRAHFDQIIAKYGHITVINLIDKTGKSATVRDQAQLGSAFQKYSKKYNAQQADGSSPSSSGVDEQIERSDRSSFIGEQNSPIPASPLRNILRKQTPSTDLTSSSSSLSPKPLSSLFPEPITYVWFDFHHECRNMKWSNLSKLMDQVGDCFSKYNWFEADRDGRVLKKQKGVFRVNCMDNLDRTNVVMSLLARRAMLQALGVNTAGITNWLDSPFDSFEVQFKNAWADNADAVSIMYAGTGALKTDFTRTGKRGLPGMIQDGINSVTRYYLNNFTDGIRQDAMDLFVANYSVDRRMDSPFTMQQQYSLFHLLMEMTLVGLMIVGVSLSVHNADDLTVRVRDGIAAAIVGFATMGYLLLKKGSFRTIGRHFVCKPSFCSSGYIRRKEA
ncbi:phosphatidylinositide phosphatase SAC1 [Thraustotheca clavata]|uniref:Phosphatidylinositide phosphatase SAC1 n=1 Tax=Thraustotheca clavata TaxID=74557 RepID=A0A1V9ZFY9_9STRA|nr:phosphatidylinositide phosphatase SAC1 [Thraustotheca clavata]